MNSALNSSATRTGVVTRGDKQSILKARALALALEPAAGNRTEEVIEFLELQVASETYAVETIHVQEVCVLKDFTTLPGVPYFVMGIMNLRGHILSIVNLKRLFELPQQGLTYQNKVVVIKNEHLSLGLLGDEVPRVRSIQLSQLQPALSTMTGFRAEYVRGITPDWTIILDAEKMLSDSRLVVDSETERTGF